ncbi:pilus assembly protein TadG-related protein [Sphingomonas baiyangensis]|uniref:Putative Flp pilus-assembly TadG-like N-terminal domain-containing protein n=1 Tax=Sphingomonas baiyangensis TaxID=2572576 RepID=A0A4U1L4M7_9SPHN|nr:pilus assembly protein TadG-related protein [Sphingomonas baiyangensis]TKD51126.1 hypothetical protein FBR43_10420 [Sphingomonas baiyangensis]
MIGALVRSRTGSASVLVAGALPMLIGAAALALDLGMVQLEARRMQGVADAAALAAATDPTGAQALAEASAGAALTVTVTTGAYRGDPGVAVADRFVAGGAAADAVRVTVARRVPTAFARVFGTDGVTIARHATAARTDMAAISIGSRLAALDGGALNAMLSAMTGSSVTLALVDYQALASAEIDLFDWLDGVRTHAALSAGTYDALLDGDVAAAAAIEALAAQVGDPVAGAALTAIAALTPGNVRLGDLIDAGPIGARTGGAGGAVGVQALDVVANVLLATGGARQFELALGGGIAGIASTRASVAIGERPAQTPWIAIDREGGAIVRTAQARIAIDAQLAPLSIPGLTPLSVRLPLFIELAGAEARIASLDCETPRRVEVEARTSPATFAIGTVDTGTLDEFGQAMTIGDAALVRAPLIAVDGSARIDMGAAEPWQQLSFDTAAIEAGEVRTVRATHAVAGVASALAGDVMLRARLLGLLPLSLDPVVAAVGAQLALVAPAIDTMIATLTGTLGLQIGAADVRVSGLRCGQPVLVG